MSTPISQEKCQKFSNDIKLSFDILTDTTLAYHDSDVSVQSVRAASNVHYYF